MFPQQFSSFEFIQKKKDILIYRAKDETRSYILKSIIANDTAVREAFYDEYESLSQLHLSCLPVYYGIADNFTYPDREGSYLTLCLEDCPSGDAFSFANYSYEEVIRILHDTGKILLSLLEQGILYTDLNPSNLLLRRTANGIHVTLVDFTYCYYYKRNPRPSYSLKFSYQLSPDLKAHQLLIQELALLLQELIMQEEGQNFPSSLFFLLETGLHPTESLMLPDYLQLLKV